MGPSGNGSGFYSRSGDTLGLNGSRPLDAILLHVVNYRFRDLHIGEIVNGRWDLIAFSEDVVMLADCLEFIFRHIAYESGSSPATSMCQRRYSYRMQIDDCVATREQPFPAASSSIRSLPCLIAHLLEASGVCSAEVLHSRRFETFSPCRPLRDLLCPSQFLLCSLHFHKKHRLFLLCQLDSRFISVYGRPSAISTFTSNWPNR